MMNTLGGQSVETAISTILTGYLVKKLNLDNMYYGFAYTLVLSMSGWIFMNANQLKTITLVNYFMPIYVIIGVGVLYAVYRYLWKSKSLDYIYINVYDEEQIDVFMNYINMYPEFFSHCCDVNVGDKDLIFQDICKLQSTDLSMTISASEDVEIPFKDTNFNISGYICWRKEVREITQDKDTKKRLYLKYLELAILKNGKDINTKKLIDNIIKHVEDHEKSEIELNYIKVMQCRNDRNHVVSIYKGPCRDMEVKEKLYIDTFFHQETDRLWSLIKMIHTNPAFFNTNGQGARLNLLLHGPSGSGKSSFIYRIAMCLERHIISLDLREFTNKSEVYQIIQCPNIPKIRQKCSYKNCILMFEEFDISILELHKRSQQQNSVIQQWWKQVNTANELLGKTRFLNSVQTDNKKTPDTKDKNSEEQEEDDAISSKDFTIRDLLEIFQGPIPFDQMILFATTNKYDEIKQLCPELFRPGRLTPVFFGYITRKVLQDISKHFFGRKLDSYLPSTMTIPTSQIIDLAMESKIQKGKQSDHFEYFQTNLNKLLDAKTE